MGGIVMLTPDELRAEIARAIEPLRVQLERLQADRSSDPISIPEAARRLGVTVRSINRWIRAGELKTVQVGGVRRVMLPDAFTGARVAA